jgi:hypothetical protein
VHQDAQLTKLLQFEAVKKMINNIARARQRKSATKNLRTILIGLLIAPLMACAAGPLANKETRELPAFHAIEVGGLVNVKIKQGDKTGVEVRAYGIAVHDIITKVEDGTLLVTTKGSHSGESISVEVIYTGLRALKTSGAATIKTDGTLTADALDIAITDAGDANLELDVKKLNIDMRGNGNLKLRGRAVSQSLTSHGGGGSFSNSGLKIVGI